MRVTYTRRWTQQDHQTSDPLSTLRAGDRCPRVGCGGLLMERDVVTSEASCAEVYCSSCARAALLTVHEPYAPMARSRDPLMASLQEVASPASAGRGSDDSMDIALPRSALDASGLGRVSDSGSLPEPPLDAR